jgi:RND family efflux transporter MFP subunit
MRLEPVYADSGPAGGGHSPSLPAGAVRVGAEMRQIGGVRVSRVERASGSYAFRLPGRVTPDEGRTHRINAGTDGYIQEVSAVTTGSRVEKNQLLATFCAPNSTMTVQTFLLNLGAEDRFKKSAAEGSPEAQSLPAAAANIQQRVQQLQNIGMSVLQMDEIRRKREMPESIKILAPADGFVLARNVWPGQKFDRGTEWYRIADLNRVWILADVFLNDAQHLRPGMRVEVRVPGQRKMLAARISEILPQFDASTRTLKARIEADNPEYMLRPDMFVDVHLPISTPPAIAVPRDAILDSGLTKTVFVERGEGMFEPRQVETGWRLGDRVEITRGLEPGEHIVVSGNFLIDSESRMRLTPASAVAVAEKTAAEKDPVCGMDVDPKNPPALKTQHGGKTWYFCSDHCKKSFEADPGKYLPKQKQGNKQSAHEAHGGRAPA